MARSVTKYFHDPVYGPIAVSSPLLLRLIDSRPVQRLKHVRQLGTSFFTFLGAEHSRFSHSIGCQHLMSQVLRHLEEDEGLRLSAASRETALAAALLHDVGHYAFSHTLEGVLGHRHEEISVRLVLEDKDLKSVLGGAARDVAALIAGRGSSGLKDLVSSQLDVDRLDYLVRDAHHTGVDSGRVDVSRIVDNLTLHQGRLVVREKGSLAVEEYFLARYFMYWKVYFHKTSRCLELILKALLRRARELHREGRLQGEGLTPALRSLFEEGASVSLRAFLDHDDSDVLVGIKAWQYGSDPLLKELSRRFLTRRKYKLIREAHRIDEMYSGRQLKRVRDYFEKLHPGSADTLFFEDHFGNAPYDLEHPVHLLTPGGRLEELSARSEVIRAVTHKLVHARYYAPHEHAEKVLNLLK